jgi:uncharacterized delta-60 repeat protein
MFIQLAQEVLLLSLRLHSYSNTFVLTIIIFLLFLSSTYSAAGMPGRVDSTFAATDARVLTRVGGSSDKARKVLVQSDGKIVVAGVGRLSNAFGDFAVVRYNLDGSLDTSFNGNGRVITTVGIQDSAVFGAVLQPDGKIVVVGEARGSNATGSDFAVVRFNSDGSLDQTFGNGGKVITPFVDNSIDYATAVAVQADGKLVVAGMSNGKFAVARYNTDGMLDQNFGANGKVTTAIGNRGDVGRAVVLQADGKIVVAGSASVENSTGNTIYQIGLARYNTNGSLDTNFNGSGKVLISIGDYNNCFDVELQSNGRIVVAGETSNNSSPSQLDFALAGFNSDGSLDTSFGVGGKVSTPIGNGDDRAYSLTVRPDNKLVVAGEAKQIFGTAPFAETNSDFSLAQYTANGALDTTFGLNGKVITPIATNDIAYDAALQADGKILLAGQAAPLATIPSIALVRYQPTGALDQTFGFKIPGSVTTVVRGTIDEARAVAVQPDGKIISVGRARVTNRYYFAVVRQHSDGSLDNSFGNNGTIITKIGTGDTDSEARSVALQADGKIVVAGRLYDANNINLSFYYFALARYNADGTLDQTFGGNGTVIVPAPNESNEAFAIGIQPNGKIVAAGFYDTLAGPQANYDMAVARLEENGSLDVSFGNNGVVTTDLGSGIDAAYALSLQPDGKILIGGIGGVSADFALVRYNTNGSLDTEFGNNGKVLTPIGTSLDEIRSIALQNDGKIIAGGSTRVGTQTDLAIARYNSNGILDTAFGNDGKVITPIASNSTDNASSVIIQASGKIIVVGTAITGVSPNVSSDIAIVRYNSTGSVDTTFGANGIIITDYASYGYAGETATGAALQTDGKLIVAGGVRDGFAFGFAGDRRNFLLARYVVTTRTSFDFDGDGRADQAVYRNGIWYLLQSQNGFTAAQFGLSADKITPADFDGDSNTDIAVYRDGFWYWLNSSNGSFNAVQFGTAGDVPVPADYTGDGRAELAVYRGGVWYALNLADNQFQGAQFGISTDKPVPADYDGDGKTDFAVYRDGTWYLLQSTAGFTAVQFGISTDKPTVGDYDGDGRADQAVYRAGVWYVLGSAQGFYGVQFGIASDIPVAADYDGDGMTDIAVYRDGVWYLLRSQQGFGAVQFGIANDKPIPAAFIP